MNPGLDCPHCNRWIPEDQLASRSVMTADCTGCPASRTCAGRGMGAADAWPERQRDDDDDGERVAPEPVLSGGAA